MTTTTTTREGHLRLNFKFSPLDGRFSAGEAQGGGKRKRTPRRWIKLAEARTRRRGQVGSDEISILDSEHRRVERKGRKKPEGKDGEERVREPQIYERDTSRPSGPLHTAQTDPLFPFSSRYTEKSTPSAFHPPYSPSSSSFLASSQFRASNSSLLYNLQFLSLLLHFSQNSAFMSRAALERSSFYPALKERR